jgi:hypothetical protein
MAFWIVYNRKTKIKLDDLEVIPVSGNHPIEVAEFYGLW